MTAPVPANVPTGCPTSLFFVDESGYKATSGSFFVVGAIKVRRHGDLLRAIRDVRDRNGYTREFKFSQISRGRLAVYFDLIDQLSKSDLHLGGLVVDRRSPDNPFSRSKPTWDVQATLIAQLLVGMSNRNELVSALIDDISSPAGTSVDHLVKTRANRRLGSQRVVTTCCLDSRSTDALQVADLVAGAILFERRLAAKEAGTPNGNKAKVVNRLKSEFNCSLLDERADRVNIATYKGRRRRNRSRKPSSPPLSVVKASKRAKGSAA